MAKLQKHFDFHLSLSAKAGSHFNSRFEHYGDLRIMGVGYYHPDCDDPFDYDTEAIWFNGCDIKQFIEYLTHTTINGADFIHNAIMAHLEGLFEYAPDTTTDTHQQHAYEIPDVPHLIHTILSH